MIATTEMRQRSALRRNRAIATGLLLAMGAIFLATTLMPEPGFWTLFVRASAEAALVGALADWFAITALFRRPLGLPIPHTAVIPRNKDRIGEGLGSFIERNFLTPELLTAKLRSLDPAHRLASWLAIEANAEATADRLVRVLPYLLNTVDDDAVRKFIGRALGDQLREIELSAVLGRMIEVMTASGYHAALLDHGLDHCRAFLERNGEQLESAAAERRRWWVPQAIDRQIARAIIRGLKELLGDLQRPESRARRKFLAGIDELAQALIVSPDHQARIEEAKNRLLEDPDMQAWLASIWDQLRAGALKDLASPAPGARAALATAIASIGHTLLADAPMRERMNASIEAAVTEFLPWRNELVRLIAEVVRKWDARILSERLELAVGSDLQYIRISGTIVGACIGSLLYLLTAALG